jgi:type I restriction enzyme, S subunit
MKTYDSYKNSGIEWIGEIPEHWITNKFGRISFFQEGPGLRQWQFADDGIKVICVTNIVPPKIDFSNYSKHISIDEYQSTYKHFTVNKGDILIASSGASWGKVSEYLDDETVILNTSTIRINANSQEIVKKEFIKWLIQCAYISEHLTLLLTGSCQPNFGPTHLNQLFCVYPKDKNEQIAIANYLDTKTTETDQIIADKEALINLYEEEKKALINEAVTKGVMLSGVETSATKLKSSGIDWLGDIPEHWEVKKLKYIKSPLIKIHFVDGPFGSNQFSKLRTEGHFIENVDGLNVITVEFVTSGDFVTQK